MSLSLITTHSVPTIEQLNIPVNAKQVALEAGATDSFRIIKLGIAVVVLNDFNQMLTLKHRERAGEYDEGALGPSMESFKQVPSRPRDLTESVLEVWQRSAAEELGCSGDAYDSAGLYIASDSVFSSGIMHLRESTGSGENDNEELIAAGYGLLLRAHNPANLLPPAGGTEEIESASYMDIDDVLSSESLRPGIRMILQQLFEAADVNNSTARPVCRESITSVVLPKVAEDIYYYDSAI